MAETHHLFGVKIYNVEVWKGIPENEVLKEADTIEELCDEFRYKFDNFLKHERCWKDSKGIWRDFDNYFPLNKEEISTIKGAIWIEWDLKYVAKMNEKGEMELL